MMVLQLGKMPTVPRLASSVEGFGGVVGPGSPPCITGQCGEGEYVFAGIAAVFGDFGWLEFGVFQKTVGLFVDRGWRWVGRVRLCSVALTAGHWALRALTHEIRGVEIHGVMGAVPLPYGTGLVHGTGLVRFNERGGASSEVTTELPNVTQATSDQLGEEGVGSLPW